MPAEPPAAAAPAPLLILGGHRSGTSLVSGLLWEAGLHMGTLLPAGPDNPRGFFESVDVLAVHEAMLAAQERDWTCPPHRLDLNTVDLEPLRKVAADLAAAGRPWGVKDPRLLFLLPAWVEVLPALRIIGVLRHPAAAAASLTARNGFGPEVARSIADAHTNRLAELQARLGFPVLDYDGPRPALLAAARGVAEAMGLEWDDQTAEALFDPGLRHQSGQGPAGRAYEALTVAAGRVLPSRVCQSWEVAQALAALPEPPGEPIPLVVGPAFPPRRHALWQFTATGGPAAARVLDVIPREAPIDPLLHGVDRAEIDTARVDQTAELHGADDAVRYSHALLTGVAETLSSSALADLLARLRDLTASDALLGLDALLVDGNEIPPVKRWPRLSATSTRSGPLQHHHLDELELAALAGGWLVGDLAPAPAGRSLVRLVKDPGRRSPDWLTSSERRSTLRRIPELQREIGGLNDQVFELKRRLDQERRRNHAAYDALLAENADIRRLYGQMREEVRRLRGLRSVRGWLAFQGRRLRPGHVAAAVKRRRGSGD